MQVDRSKLRLAELAVDAQLRRDVVLFFMDLVRLRKRGAWNGEYWRSTRSDFLGQIDRIVTRVWVNDAVWGAGIKRE